MQTIAATTLQAGVRGWLTRKRHTPTLKAMRQRKQAKLAWQLTLFQARAKGCLMRQTCSHTLQQLRERRERFKAAVIVAQAHSRGYLVRNEYGAKMNKLRAERIEKKEWLNAVVSSLQASCRGYLVRKTSKPELDKVCQQRKEKRVKFEAGVVQIQACCRGYLIRTLHAQRMREQHTERQRRKQLQQVRTLPDDSVAPRIPPASSTRTVQTAASCNTPPRQPRATPCCPEATSGQEHTIQCHSDSNSPNSSPGKPKLTLLRRLQSALKTLHSSSLPPSSPNTTPHMHSDLSSSTPTLPSPPRSSSTGQQDSETKVTSAPPLLQKARNTPKSSLSETTAAKSVKSLEEDDVELEAYMPAEEQEAISLAAEEKALQEVVRSREEEIAVAQLARERMSTIFSEDEIKIMAERQRKRSSYQKELEYAATPLLPRALVGLVEDRLTHWKANYTSRKNKTLRRQQTSENQCAKATPCDSCPLSTAQLLAASSKGSSLEEVEQVIVYGCRHAVDLSSLKQCSHLRSATLVKCGLDSLAGLQGSTAPNLVELNVPVSMQLRKLIRLG